MIRKTTIAAAVAASLGMSSVQAAVYNMTFMDFPGSPNSSIIGTIDTATGTGSFDSGPTPLFSNDWTATVTGTYSATDGSQGIADIGAGSFSSSMLTGASATGTYNYTLASGQVAMALLFDWSTLAGIPIINIFNADGSGVDINGNGTFGTIVGFGGSLLTADGTVVSALGGGPLAGASIGFSGSLVSAVPVPSAFWLLGSGLVGLAGRARRRKKFG